MQRLMNRLIVLLLPLFILVGTAFSYTQEGPPPGSPMEQMTPKDAAAHELKELTKRLSLTDEQTSSIRPILESRHEQLAALFSNPSGPRSDMDTQFKTIMTSTNSQIRDLLTESQKTKFDKLAKRRPVMGDGPDGMGGGPGPDGGPPPGGGPGGGPGPD